MDLEPLFLPCLSIFKPEPFRNPGGQPAGGALGSAWGALNAKAAPVPSPARPLVSELVAAGATGERDHLAAKIFFLSKLLGARGMKLPGG